MSLLILLRNTETACYEVYTIAEGIETNANAVLTGCTTEHPVNGSNRAKCCNKILTAVDS